MGIRDKIHIHLCMRSHVHARLVYAADMGGASKTWPVSIICMQRDTQCTIKRIVPSRHIRIAHIRPDTTRCFLFGVVCVCVCACGVCVYIYMLHRVCL